MARSSECQTAGERIFKSLGYIIYICRSFLWVLWARAKPFFASIISIYETIDFDNLDLVYVLKAFLKWYLMVVVFAWQRAKAFAHWVVCLFPRLRLLVYDAYTLMLWMDTKYGYLRRPLHRGLFSRKA